MTRIDIISGFLGAGKTTLIKKLLGDALKGQQVVLIENEFGEIGIDGGFLKDAGIEIREMNSGCICCSLVGDFGAALKDVITKYHPDRIIIEPSGVGKLSDVIKAVDGVEKEAGVALNSATTVVDVMKCKMYLRNFGEFFENQVKSAGTIILSRTDKADTEKVEAAVKMLRELNPEAHIITTPVEVLGGKKVLDTMEGAIINLAQVEEEEHHHHHHDHDECCCGHDHDEEHEHHHHDHEEGHGCGHCGSHEDEESGCGHCGSDEGESDCGSGCGGCGGGCGTFTPSFEGPNVGKKVKVHYKGTLNDGTQFDSSYDRGEPLEFTCGAGMMIQGFDKAVATMNVGDVIDVHLMPEEAYGEADPRAFITLPISELPGAEELKVDDKVYLQNMYGQPFPARVAALTDTEITFDANHEMAGKELNFRIELVEVL